MRKVLYAGFVLGLMFYGWRLVAESGDSATFGWDATNEVSIMRANSSYNVIPGKDDTYDLGDGTYQWQDLYLDGTLYADGISNAGTLSQTGALTITGAASVSTDMTATGSMILGEGAHQELVVSTGVTATEMQSLYGTPVKLIDAPGANYAIVFLDAVVLYDRVGAGYDDVDTDEQLVFCYTSSDTVVVAEIETTGMIDQTNDELRYVKHHSAAVGNNSSIELRPNEPLVIQLESGEVYSAAGDSPLDIVIHYKIVATDL